MTASRPAPAAPPVVLVNMPWHAPWRPAPLGLGILKAVLAARGFASRVEYLNLRWMERVAARIGARGRAGGLVESLADYDLLGSAAVGEWIFAQQLPGADGAQARALLEGYPLDEELGRTWRHLPGFLALSAAVPEFYDDCLRRLDWHGCALVGFSSSFTQQAASLGLARRLKQEFPHLRVVLGGANCFAPMGRALLERYEWLDYVAEGEAENGIVALVEAVLHGREPADVPGFAVRGGDGVVRATPVQPVTALDELPVPDYDDYFAQLAESPLAELVRREVAVETSRGCWWGQKHHCTFCGLNWDQRTARRKSPERVLAEIETLVTRHDASRVLFADAIMPRDHHATLLPALARRAPRLRLFWELKANVTRPEVAALRAAGVDTLQPGIESLSTRILRLMRKGVTALQNIACLKYCADLGVTASWNLLYGVPGEQLDDYRRVLELLSCVTHLARPRLVRMLLARFSAYHLQPEAYGIANLRPYRHYPLILPGPAAPHAELCRYFDYDFPFPVDPEAAVAPIRALLHRWHEEAVPGDLRLRDLPDGTSVIDDTRFNRVVGWVALDPAQAAAYRFCDRARSLAAITRHVGGGISGQLGPAALRALLADWVAQRLMVAEDDRYLSLALTTPRPEAPLVMVTGAS